MELIAKFWPEAKTLHITYDPEMKSSDRDYCIIEQTGHDGTLCFTLEMMQKALIRLVNCETYCKRKMPKDGREVIGINYRIGLMRHVIAFGQIELRCGGKYRGQAERVRIPVIADFQYS